MTDSNKAADKQHWAHAPKKQNPHAQAPEVCEKTFSTYFVAQPVENTT